MKGDLVMVNKKPKYESVKVYILTNIAKGIYQAHQIIEPEFELSEKLNVSRITVRRGIEELVKEKTLTKKKGIGTFVNVLPKFFGFKAGIGFSLEAKNLGLIPSSKLLRLEKVQASKEQAIDMGVELGDLLWLVERIRYADKVPICYELEYFDASIAPNLTAEVCEKSIYEHLKTQGIEYEFVDQQISASLSDKQTSEYLNIKINSPLIDTKIIACLENGKPFNVGYTLYQTVDFYLVHTVYK